ncbi:ganglioside GM2 activator isoform X1 [Betta splendens]|uniref:Ganglioside GM2 activator isoform X1 n=1 Tax=Betta splendens TaxID=158456 RepID=A0A9W2Y3D2_BETSP|nr:ganglioside GM2 activator isoform X1 [Betta splendens]XP_055368450.1 ganglioside GM2 activator isoform X1 [Betta splendens]XP_055368451.1 ganglioside GM2 activator isoform X1 [Betta splendens]XP_055368452.1 ganglioside GM2 activator isoform X1 [Betta splendens]XP_055368453.1 ganglioside GM2 activator isoform X1 [Betta splendens]
MERRSLRGAALALLVAAAVAQVNGVGKATGVQVRPGPKRVRACIWSEVEILGFDWKNCGKDDDPAVMKSLTLSPDPIQIPGDLNASASGSTSVELKAPLCVNVTLEKEVAGFWVKVPCVEQMGSCHYPNVCDLLNQLIPPGQNCPEPLHTYGLPCHCPFKAGSYFLPQSDFSLPNMDLPYWLTNGKYRVQGVLGCEQQELGCLLLTLALHSS